MKRPLGLIGLTYLSILAVIFYCDNEILFDFVIVISGLTALTGSIIKFFNRKITTCNYLITVGFTGLVACLSLILYTNFTYLPVVNNYSDKELSVQGYICEEVKFNENGCEYIIATYTVNGEKENIKIKILSYMDLNVSEFDVVNVKLYAYKSDLSSSLSKNIFLSSYTDDKFSIEETGDTHFSLYSYAIKIRKAMKYSLDLLLPDSYSSLCKAVLLGDKQALSLDVRNDISQTGTTFLIVVSGMHLSIVTSFVLFLLKKITSNRIIICVSVCFIAISFMAITGFTPSVIRSGVMLIITYCSTVAIQKADALNSLGIAGIVLTIFNPYAVGDIGMILSFTATMGIIMWESKISSYIINKLKIKKSFIKSAVNIISTSISASLWIIPITTLAFGKISPLVVLVSFLTETLISIVLVCAMVSSILFLCPFISFMAYPFALVAGLTSKLFLFIISYFSQLSFCSVNSNKIYFYIWIFSTIVLVVVGYIIKAKGFYIKSVVLFSFATLIIGWSIYSLVDDYNAKLKVYNTGNGVTATVENGDDIVLLSCGGNVGKYGSVYSDIERNHSCLDFIIIPKQNKKYSSYLNYLITEFDSEQILVYDINSEKHKYFYEYDGFSRVAFGNNLSFKINVNDNISDEICNVDGLTSQFVKIYDKTVLFLISGTDVNKIPKKYRSADYLIIDKLPDNYNLLDCDTLIYSGTKKYYNENYNAIKEISENINVTYKDTVTINLSGG